MRASKQRWVLSALVRPAFWFCACNLLAAAMSAQCTNPTQVPNGTYTSGDHSQVDNNALSASSFSVSGGASATFVAGNCIQLLPGFHASANGASVPTTFHSWVDIAPSAIAPSPSNGTGFSQQFTFTVSSPSGYGSLAHVFALFGTADGSTTNACYIHYDPSSDLVYLADNSSTSWLGGFRPSSTGSAANSQCTISGTGATNPTSSGSQLSLKLNIEFQQSFSGPKQEFLYALDASGMHTEWRQFGTWNVSNPGVFAPIRINSGGRYTDSMGQAWEPDYGYDQSLGIWQTNTTISGTSDQRLYQTERFNVPDLVYRFFSVPNGNYIVTLKFAEIYDGAPGQRYMNIALNGTTVLTGLDVWTAAGGPNRAYDRSFPVSVTNSQLTISLTTSPNNSAEVNSIQIVAAGEGTVADPTFTPGTGSYSGAQTVTISTTPSDASIYYTTDGSTPSSNSTPYSGAVSITTSQTVKAIAYKAGWNPSNVVSAAYTISSTVADPTFTPGTGSYSSAQPVEIRTTTSEASIYYTTDGTTPSSNSTPYSGAVSVTTSQTLKAIAYKTGWNPSNVVSAAYTISSTVADPTFTPGTGSYSSAQIVEIRTTTSEASIYYTTDGTTPSSNSTPYSGAVSVTTSQTLKAIAYKAGWNNSDVVSAAYIIGGTQTYTISGHVMIGGCPLSGVSVGLTGEGSAQRQTDAAGAYSFSGLASGNYTVTPSKTGYTFTPAPAQFSLTGNQTKDYAANGPALPSREYIRLGGRVIAVASCGGQ